MGGKDFFLRRGTFVVLFLGGFCFSFFRGVPNFGRGIFVGLRVRCCLLSTWSIPNVWVHLSGSHSLSFLSQ